MQQQNAKHSFRTLDISRALHRSAQLGLFFPTFRQKLLQNIPVFKLVG
jgi:hypothetical protein